MSSRARVSRATASSASAELLSGLMSTLRSKPVSSNKEQMSVSRFVPGPVKGTRIYGVAQRNKPEVKRFGRFAIVGGTGLILDIVLLNVFERSFGLTVPVAVALAFIIAATNNFVWTRLWVYPESRSQKKRRQLPLFLAINTAGLLINELFFLLFLQAITSAVLLVPIPFVQLHYRGIGLNVTKLIAAVFVMLWNFFVNRFVTFGNVKWQKNIPPEVAAQPEMIDSAL
jgi:dolichol-phosphate mannosyltransferase